MKNFTLKTLLLSGCIALTALSSCMFSCVHGSGHETTEQHKVEDFTGIDISGAYKVILKQDSSLTVNVTADDNLQKYIHVVVNGNKLRIYSKKNFCDNSGMVVHIGVRNLEEVKASGGVEIEAEGKITAQDINFKLTGGTKLTMELNAARVFTRGSGATEVFLKGQATSHTVELTGSGKISAYDFVVGNYDIRTTGATSCQINVLHELDVNTTGASEIEYKGNPTTVNDHKTGASSIKKVD